MEISSDELEVRGIVESLFRAFDGPDWAELPAGLDAHTTVFLAPSATAGEAPRPWHRVHHRLKSILVGARTGPQRPRLKPEKPRFAVEVRGDVATVSWRTNARARRNGRSRGLGLVRSEDGWHVRHLHLWTLPMMVKADLHGRLHWLDVHPLLAAEKLPDEFLSAAAEQARLWYPI